MISIDWGTKVINVPKSDTVLVSIGPPELREFDVDAFRLNLKALEASAEGMPFLDTHTHNTEVVLSGITYARFFILINGYTVTFENGQYQVRLFGANHNIADFTNPNSVGILTQNSAGLISTQSGKIN